MTRELVRKGPICKPRDQVRSRHPTCESSHSPESTNNDKADITSQLLQVGPKCLAPQRATALEATETTKSQ
ncbi:hypothetical protein PISMIDRAFT_683969 [Pisolithus microcarpus 441]|uniref:Uncharacterized protein n=1 Tax=Pisolithus microcarpus 441 TaxID=765257 RepID=A0A0C9YXL6_9AGAM|nr:hypothetical protein PISMIDRAFT_683969 [Pisolithus microcarpus 441]